MLNSLLNHTGFFDAQSSHSVLKIFSNFCASIIKNRQYWTDIFDFYFSYLAYAQSLCKTESKKTTLFIYECLLERYNTLQIWHLNFSLIISCVTHDTKLYILNELNITKKIEEVLSSTNLVIIDVAWKFEHYQISWKITLPR